MLMTNLVYDVAFPTTYLYSFPVRIKELRSVMTIGTERALLPFEHSALTRIVTTIFMHPLLLDYATREAEATESKNKMLLMGGCAHSANNALAMSEIRSLTSKLASGEPPQKARFTLQRGSVDEALNLLRALWVGGRAAQAFIALIEMATRPGALRKKFLSKTTYTLDECLIEAERMTKVHVERNPLRLGNLQIERNPRFWVDVRLPELYLEKIYIQTLLYELLLNVCKHGATTQVGKDPVATAGIATKLVDGNLEIHITNRLAKDAPKFTEYKGVMVPDTLGRLGQSGNTFLQFASVLSEFVRGIKVTSDIYEDEFYHAVLTLSPIPVDNGDGTSTWVRPEALFQYGS